MSGTYAHDGGLSDLTETFPNIWVGGGRRVLSCEMRYVMHDSDTRIILHAGIVLSCKIKQGSRAGLNNLIE